MKTYPLVLRPVDLSPAWSLSVYPVRMFLPSAFRVVRDAKVCGTGTFEVLEAVDGGVPVVSARVGEKAREKAHCEANVCSHCVGDVVQGPDELSIAGEFC